MKYILINLYGFPQQHQNSSETKCTVADNYLDCQQPRTNHPPALERHLIATSPSLLIVRQKRLSKAVHRACVDLTFSCISEIICDKSLVAVSVGEEAFRG